MFGRRKVWWIFLDLPNSIHPNFTYNWYPYGQNPLAKLIICQLLLIHKFTPTINDTKYSCLMVRIHTFHTIQKIWDHYIACCETTRHRTSDVMQPVSYWTFCRYWLKRLSHIVIGKPCSDLCWTCQQNSMAIMKLANASDHQKQKVT